VIEPHVLSVTLLATNRGLGASVRPGELSEPGVHMPPRVKARNIVATSPYLPARSGPGFALRATVRGQVAREDPLYTLKGLLYSLVPHQAFEADASRGLIARVDAVEGLEVESDWNVQRTRRGYLASFVIDETPFSGSGDVALFLRVLHHVLDAGASLNRFFRCEVLCTKSGERWSWPPARLA
jgi:type VI protein secretion system component VasA